MTDTFPFLIEETPDVEYLVEYEDQSYDGPEVEVVAVRVNGADIWPVLADLYDVQIRTAALKHCVAEQKDRAEQRLIDRAIDRQLFEPYFEPSWRKAA